MGRGYYKKKTTRQYKKRSYDASVGKSRSMDSTPSTRKYETVLAKTKGYDELQKKKKERRGRKKKK